MSYYAVMRNGTCIAKIVWDGVGPYDFPHPHDELVYDPYNIIAVETGTEPPQDPGSESE
jgi:hypothetical protein